MNINMLEDQAKLWQSFIPCFYTKSWSAERYASVMDLAYFYLKNVYTLFHYFSNGYTLKNQCVSVSGIFSEGTTLRSN